MILRGKTVVYGGGSWGTALANLLAQASSCTVRRTGEGTGDDTENGAYGAMGLRQDVILLVRDPKQAEAINREHENSRYLPGEKLSPGVRAVVASSPEGVDALAQTGLLVLSVPCQVMRGVLESLRGALSADCVLVNTAKGIETRDLVTGEQMVATALPEALERFAVLSGPSFALEVIRGKPTAVVLGCRSETLGAALRNVFYTPRFRAYSSTDVTGVELGGAVKNIIAIAAGISDGLGFGLNTRAALVTRGLAEISRLGLAMNARQSTFMGLSGMGDLLLTCSGDLSRNRQVGLRLGRGESLQHITDSLHMVAEGVKTTDAVYRLARSRGVDMPVTSAMHAVLYEGLNPVEAVETLMNRALREE